MHLGANPEPTPGRARFCVPVRNAALAQPHANLTSIRRTSRRTSTLCRHTITAAQVAAIGKIRSDFSSAVDLRNGLKATEFAALNRKLTAANLPEIQFNMQPTHEEDEDDQDLE